MAIIPSEEFDINCLCLMVNQREHLKDSKIRALMTV